MVDTEFTMSRETAERLVEEGEVIVELSGYRGVTLPREIKLRIDE